MINQDLMKELGFVSNSNFQNSFAIIVNHAMSTGNQDIAYWLCLCISASMSSMIHTITMCSISNESIVAQTPKITYVILTRCIDVTRWTILTFVYILTRKPFVKQCQHGELQGITIPSQWVPFPEKPSLHEQLNVPTIFSQVAFLSHGWFTHSSMSWKWIPVHRILLVFI